MIPRLYLNQPLVVKQMVMLEKAQSHYLVNVLRRKEGDAVLLFNGKDGEFSATINSADKKECSLLITEQTKAMQSAPEIHLIFAPVKTSRAEYLIEKATELGVSSFYPVITEHSIVRKVNVEKLTAHAVEAAEQSERLTVPEVHEIQPLQQLLSKWQHHTFVGDETGQGKPFPEVLNSCKEPTPHALLIGPEGGFSPKELGKFNDYPFISKIGLGPRILRADTAGIAMLTVWQSLMGDWDTPPDFKGVV